MERKERGNHHDVHSEWGWNLKDPRVTRFFTISAWLHVQESEKFKFTILSTSCIVCWERLLSWLILPGLAHNISRCRQVNIIFQNKTLEKFNLWLFPCFIQYYIVIIIIIHIRWHLQTQRETMKNWKRFNKINLLNWNLNAHLLHLACHLLLLVLPVRVILLCSQ